MNPTDLLDLLKALTVEQRLELAESLPIPSWQPGTMFVDCFAGDAAEVVLDRDLEGATTVTAKNITGVFILQGTRVMVRKDGAVLQIDGILEGTGLPAGIVVGYAGATEPSWGVFATGQTVPTVGRYARLAVALAETGSTMTLPDLRDRIPRYLDAETLLSVAGASTVTIAKANLPSYNLTVTDPGHRHYDGDDTGANSAASGAARQEPGAGTAGSKRTSTEVTGITVASGGSGTALSVLNPVIYLNGLITL